MREAERPDAVLLTHGILVNEALAAARLLEERGLRTQVWKVNRIDGALKEQLGRISEQADWCVVLEDVVQSGGLGETMAQVHRGRLDLLNTGDRFLPHGSVPDIYRACGIDAESVADYMTEKRKAGENGLG